MELTEQHRRTLRKIQLDILDIVVGICEEEGIEWYLVCGSLLGAVRHGGYIPWDDDIDIAMKRSEYDRFLQVAPAKMPAGYKVHNPDIEQNLPILFTKVAKEGTLFCSSNWVEIGAPMGVCIDIFPFDYVSNDPKKREKQGNWGLWYDNMVVSSIDPSFHILASEHGGIVGALDHALCALLRRSMALRRFVRRKHRALGTRYQNTEWLANISERCVYQHFFRADWVYPLGTVEFEGRQLPAPGKPDLWLTSMYGDYMQLPPESERGGHGMDRVILGDEEEPPEAPGAPQGSTAPAH